MPWTNDDSARDFFFKPLHPGTEHNVFTAQMVPSSPSSAPHEVYVYKFVSANESRACNIEAIRTAWGSEQFDLRKVAVFTLPRYCAMFSSTAHIKSLPPDNFKV
jgi:hypothetical protein